MPNKKEFHLHSLTYPTDSDSWYKADAYGEKHIEKIADKTGGNTAEAPTSIPSPFARFDLLKTAFGRLAQRDDLEGDANDKRLVSACFDVGQIFFSYDTLRQQPGAPGGQRYVEIIPWEKLGRVQALKNSGTKGHQRLGSVLDMFLSQDKKAYNFDRFERLFILRYIGPSGAGYIGGTSPTTLFFGAPNDLDFVDIRFDNRRVFDPQNPVPLHQRDLEYQKLWHGLFKHNPEFQGLYKEVYRYLKKSLALFRQLNYAKFEEHFGDDLVKLDVQTFDGLFKPLEISTPQGTVEVDLLSESPGATQYIPWRKARPSGDVINAKSQFKIDSVRYRRRNPNAFMPLVLQSVYKSLDYTGKAAWVNGTPVPHYHEASWRNNARQLPNTADFYPFLTANDFLEPTLLRLVYPINRARYFDGNLRRYDDKSQRSYLLPLKPDFFEFFSAEELASDVVQLRIEETQQAGAGALSTSRVRVTLRVPIAAKGQYVEFRKEYEEKPDQPVSDQTLKGQVVERQFGLTLFPCLRIDDPAFVPQYRVHLVDRDVAAATYNEVYSLKFYADGDALAPLPGIVPRERSKKQINVGAQTTVYPVRQNFERIDVEVGGYRGVIVPKWRRESLGDVAFTVAIDFGTTNTHIEYNTAGDPTPRPFTIEAEDIQIATLHDPATPEEVFNDSGTNAIADLVPLELIPERIGPGHLSRFPQRTVLLENKPDFSLNPVGFADFNVAFSYERRTIPPGHKPVSDLKWADLAHQGDAPRKRVEAYFQSLLFLMRNKILLNGGNPDRTDLRWFYPLSMTTGQSQTFDDTWKSTAREYLGPNAQVRKVPESIAPFYWYSRGGGANARIVAFGHPSVLVDIGGGTSDIVVFQNNQPTLISSVRFAANSLFGDGFSQAAAERNGFVRRYDNKVAGYLNSGGGPEQGTEVGRALAELRGAHKSISQEKRSADIVAFYFSLATHPGLKDRLFDFNAELRRDPNLKWVFIVFYGALVYHVAQLMKARGLGMPRFLTFSGTGSRVLDVISTHNLGLESLAKLIFQKVYGVEAYAVPDGLTLVREREFPKEVTCKGVLKMEEADFQNVEKLTNNSAVRTTLLGSGETLAGETTTYQGVTGETLRDVGEEVRRFVQLLLRDLPFDYEDQFGVNGSLKTAIAPRLVQDLDALLNEGWMNRFDRTGDKSKKLDETLFFLPLIEGLNQLANYLADQSTTNPS